MQDNVRVCLVGGPGWDGDGTSPLLRCLVGSHERTGTSHLGIYLAYSQKTGTSSPLEKGRTGAIPLRRCERLLPSAMSSLL